MSPKVTFPNSEIKERCRIHAFTFNFHFIATSVLAPSLPILPPFMNVAKNDQNIITVAEVSFDLQSSFYLLEDDLASLTNSKKMRYHSNWMNAVNLELYHMLPARRGHTGYHS